MILSIRAVEQLPVCNRITFGGALQIKLKLAKSLSLCQKSELVLFCIPPYDRVGRRTHAGVDNVD
jgi:hypothetical protein